MLASIAPVSASASESRHCPAADGVPPHSRWIAPPSGVALLPDVTTGMTMDEVRRVDPRLVRRGYAGDFELGGLHLPVTAVFDGHPARLVEIQMHGGRQLDEIVAALTERFGPPLDQGSHVQYVDNPTWLPGGTPDYRVVDQEWCDGPRTFDLYGSRYSFDLTIRVAGY